MRGASQVSSRRIDWSLAAWIGLALYAAWALRHFLHDGLPLEFDAHSHLARTAFVERAFAGGQYPSWANDWYGGYRLLEFYSPLWYWITAGMGLALRDVVLAVKLVVWATQVASVALLFAFVRRIGARTLPAVLAGVLLVHSAERGIVFGVVGNYPSTLLYLTIPALLLLAWGNEDRRFAPRRLFAGQALLVSAMLAGHFANALLVLPAILAVEVTRVAQVATDHRDRLQIFGAIGGSLLAATALLAFALVPAFLHLDHVSLSLDRSSLAVDRPSIEPLLIAAGILPAEFEHPFLRDHGTFWMALGVIAGLLSLLRKYRRALPLFAGLCVNLATIMLVDERAAIGLGFFLYPLCAVAFDDVARWAETVGPRILRFAVPAAGVAAAIVFAVDFPPPRYMPTSTFDVYRTIPESPTRSRILDVSPNAISLDGFYGPSSYSPHLSGRAIPFGAYPQGATPATQLRLAMTSILVEELYRQSPALSNDALDILYLDHVQFLVARAQSPVTARVALQRGMGELLGPELLKLEDASPAIFAAELSPLPDWTLKAGARDRSPRLLGILERAWQEDPLDLVRARSVGPLFRTRKKRDWEPLLPLLRAMEVDRRHARAARIFVDEPSTQGASPSSMPTEFAVLSHLEEPNHVRIVGHASRSGYVRISYAHDPSLLVLLDDEPVETTADALGGAVVVAFPAGTHTIDVGAPESALQTGLLFLGFFFAVVLLVILARDRKATKSQDRHPD